MKVVAGRDQVFTKSIDLDPGLYALLHEGAGDDRDVSVHVLLGSGEAADLTIHPMNKLRSGSVTKGEFVLLNATATCRALVVVTGSHPEQSKINLRLVSLDLAIRQDARESVPALILPGAHRPLFNSDDASVQLETESGAGADLSLIERYQSRLVEISAGAHLLRFPKSTVPTATSLLFSPLGQDAKFFLSGMPATVFQMTRGQVAVIDCAAPNLAFLTMVAEGIELFDFSSITIQPLESLFQQFTAPESPSNVTDSFSEGGASANIKPLGGIRVGWTERPLGLDVAMAVKLGSRAAFDQPVMSSTWQRADDGDYISGIRLALIGLKRSTWSLELEGFDVDGNSYTSVGSSVEITAPSSALASVRCVAVPRQGNPQPLAIDAA
ncbi:MAG: hypothetical protein ACRC7C_00905 [Beijerinckiaceae bacterium]